MIFYITTCNLRERSARTPRICVRSTSEFNAWGTEIYVHWGYPYVEPPDRCGLHAQ